MKTLHLHVTFEYFDHIESGEKTEEYREYEKWKSKIEGKQFDAVTIWRGYTSKKLTRPWRWYCLQLITHKRFKNKTVRVFAIKLEKP